jgi:hypothetical protein
VEPNDRRYDGKVAGILRQLRPEELDTLLTGEEDERLNFSTDNNDESDVPGRAGYSF